MKVEINETSSRTGTDEIDHLINALTKAYGSQLPEKVERIVAEPEFDNYTIYVAEDRFGTAFGECLVTHGWAINGFHSHDVVSVIPIDECDLDNTILYDEGDEDSISVNVVDE